MDVKFFKNQAAFRKWLEKNHVTARELWVAYYETASGKSGLTYPEAVDEALCFGWIDGIVRRIDEISYTNRFTPRKPKSNWSAVNIERMRVLIEQGKVTPAGLEAFGANAADRSKQYSYENESRSLSEEYERIFKQNVSAWDFYCEQSASYRRMANWWVMSAKRDETRERRLAQLIKSSENGERLKQFMPPSKQQ